MRASMIPKCALKPVAVGPQAIRLVHGKREYSLQTLQIH